MSDVDLSQAHKEADQERLGILYLTSLGAKGAPHPLFDAAYYQRNNPDVVAANQNPLQHYMTFGAFELRNPHALFDAKYYVSQAPNACGAGVNPLLHFLSEGANQNHKPNRYFDPEYYKTRNPEVAALAMNPLVHYVKYGAQKGYDPHPLFSVAEYFRRYPDVEKAGAEPLAHYLEFGKAEHRTLARPLYFSERAQGGVPGAFLKESPRRRMPASAVSVFCVYGPGHVEFLQEAVIPAFAKQQTDFPLELHFVNYKDAQPLLKLNGPVEAHDWSAARPAGNHMGFGESVNFLFECVKPAECFFLCNPDSFPMPECLTQLMNTYLSSNAGIVEAQQWPSAHPKEFDTVTLETPWASGAFNLISSRAFSNLGGFDPIYFLYMEDVDLSWRVWLSGLQVLHQPLARCVHATGMYSYHRSRFYYEHFFSLRNFLLIAYKFWKELGETIAFEYLKQVNLPHPLLEKIVTSYRQLRPSIKVQPVGGMHADKVKILGLNVFHEFK